MAGTSPGPLRLGDISIPFKKIKIPYTGIYNKDFTLHLYQYSICRYINKTMDTPFLGQPDQI